MTRDIDDNPSGWSRSLPGHTVELDPGFASPWNQIFSQSISAGAYIDFTLNFNDPYQIYFVDMISVSPQASKELAAMIYVNGVNYVASAGVGWLEIPLRRNPSIVFINGDSLTIRVYNLDGSTRNFVICVNGTKIKRPTRYGHSPGAYFTLSPNPAGIDEVVSFTDGSTYSPTKWEWYFEPGVLGSTLQNPVYKYETPGNKYPILKAYNQYGWDSYGLSSPLVVCNGIRCTAMTEYDPIGKISPEAACQVSIVGVDNDETAYIYRDYGSGYFNNIDINFTFSVHNYIATNSECVSLALGNSVGDCHSATGYRYVVLISNYAGVLTVRLRLHNGNYTYGGDPTLGISVDTNYYCKLVRPAGSLTATLYVYNDEARTSLKGSLTTNAVAGGDSAFRYLYLSSSYNYGVGGRTSGVTTINTRVWSH